MLILYLIYCSKYSNENTGHTLLWMNVFKSWVLIPKKGIWGPYGKLILIFLWTLHNIFQRGWTKQPKHQQWMTVPFSPHLCQRRFLLLFWICTIATGIRWYHIFVLIWKFSKDKWRWALNNVPTDNLFDFIREVSIDFLSSILVSFF